MLLVKNWLCLFGLLSLCLGVTGTASANAPISLGTSSYLGGSGDNDAVRGLEILSDGRIVLAANIGDAEPGGLTPHLLNGATVESNGALVILSPDGKTVLSVTRLADVVYDLSIDDSDRIYLAAGTSGMLKVSSDGQSLLGQRLAGQWVHRVDASPSGYVVCLVPTNTWGDSVDDTPGNGVVTLYDPALDLVTSFNGFHHTLDIAIHEDSQSIIYIGWYNGYAFTGPDDLGGGVTVHIAYLRSVSFAFNGNNTEEIRWTGYNWDGSNNVWLDYNFYTDTFVVQPRFLNSPLTFDDVYTEDDIDAAIASGDPQRAWLGYRYTQEDIDATPELDASHLDQLKFLGKPRNIVYAMESAAGNYQPQFIDMPKNVTEGNNMADTRGFRVTVGRDNLLYAGFEAAGGNHIFRWSPFELGLPTTIVGGDLFHQMVNTGASHKSVVVRYDPVTGEALLTQLMATVARNGGAPGANTLRMKGGSIAVDEEGRLYFGGAAASQMPMWPSDYYTPREGESTFNPFTAEDYLGGACFYVLSPDFATREFVTRLTTGGTTKAVAGRILEGETEPRIAWGGEAVLGSGPVYVRDAFQPQPGYGEADGFVAVAVSGSENPNLPYRFTYHGEYTDGVNLRLRNSDPTITVADLDGNGQEDDAIMEYAWDPEGPLSPTTGYSGPEFRGGIRFNYLNRTDPSPGTNTFNNSSLSLRVQPSGDQTTDVNGVFFFDKSAFPGIDSEDKLSFSRNTVVTLRASGLVNGRWLVREGDIWYVHEERFPETVRGDGEVANASLSFPSNDSDGRWAIWTPSPEMMFVAATAIFHERKFQDITAIGFITNKLTNNDGRIWVKWERFSAEFEINQPINTPPVAQFTADHFRGRIPFEVHFDATASFDAESPITFYAWDFRNSLKSSGPFVSTTFTAAGPYDVELTVYDDELQKHSTTRRMEVGSAIGGDLDQTVAAFGGKAVDVNRLFEPNFTNQAGSWVADDGETFDTWVGAPFTTNRITRNEVYGTPWRGGIIGQNRGGNQNFGDFGIYHGSLEDSFRLRHQPGGSTSSRMFAAVYIDKQDFIGLGNTRTVTIDEHSRITLGGISSIEQVGNMRWMIRDGDQFYVSEERMDQPNITDNEGNTDLVLTFTSAVDHGNWAPYDPAERLQFDRSTPFAPHTFSDVTAVGFMIDKLAFNNLRVRLNFRHFEFLAAVDQSTEAPVASFTVSAQQGEPLDVFEFDAGASTASGGIVHYHWDFGDGGMGNGETISHLYGSEGVYTVTLTITDDTGQTATYSQTVTIEDFSPPPPTTHTVTFTAGTGGSLSGNLNQTVSEGNATTEVSAEAEEGYSFVNWTWTGDNASTNNPLSIPNVTQDLSVTAHFEEVVVPNTPPSVTITAPADNTIVTEGDSITFTGTATDAEDEDAALLADATWTSDRDGLLGTGGSVSTNSLSVGTHSITFAVTDSGGLSDSDQITLTVDGVSPDTYTMVIDFGKDGQETNSPGYWNNITGSGNWEDDTTLSSSLVRQVDGVPTGISFKIERIDPGGRAGIGGLDIAVGDQDGDAAFTVSGNLPGSAQRDIAFFSADGRAQFVFENLDDTKVYQLEFQTLHTAPTAAANWTVQPGTAHEQVRLISRNKGAAHYSPVQVFEKIQTDGEGRIVLRSAGDIAQNINALELTASPMVSPPPPTTHTVTFTAGTGGNLSGDLNQTVSEGDATIEVTAEAEEGYSFVNWTWTGDNASTNNPLSIPNVTQDLSVTAHFEEVVVPNTPPSVTITAPADNTIVTEGDSITFTGTATDAEDEDAALLADATWTSDRDGLLGTGGSVSTNTLSVGTHSITFAVTDSGGLSDSASITLTVESAEESLVLVRYTFENGAAIGTQHSTSTFVRQTDADNVAAEITASPFTIGNHHNHNARLIATDSANDIAGAAQIAGIESNLFQWQEGAAGNPYYEFTVEGATALQSLRMVVRSGSQWNNTGSFLSYEANRRAEISVRSSLDNYGANIGSVFTAGNAGAFAEQIIDLSGLVPDGQAVTFRIYPRSPNEEDPWYRVQVDQVEVTGTVSAPPEDLYALWVAENNITGGLGDETNGIPNLLRYALGGTADSSVATMQPIVETNADTLTLRFEQIADPALHYEVWASDDLVNWGTSPIWSSTGVENHAGEIVVSDSVLISEAPRRFFRLVVWRD